MGCSSNCISSRKTFRIPIIRIIDRVVFKTILFFIALKGKENNTKKEHIELKDNLYKFIKLVK